MTNDYMLQAIFQSRNNVLKGLIASMLHLDISQIKSVEVKNPIALGVVDLTHIELATEEDKTYQIDYWARLFKATTWEELKMIAQLLAEKH